MNKQRKPSRINSYTGMLLFAATLLILSFLTFIIVCQIYSGKFRKTDAQQHYDKYYVMIVDDYKADFWKNVYDSAYRVGQEQNVYVDLLGSNLSRDYTREELMQIAMYSDVDGIIIEADESRQMTDLINQAVDAGIPVVTLNGDNTASKRSSYVGIGNYDLGREYGRQILRLADGKPKSVAVLVNAQASDAGQNIVWAGIQETIEQENEEKLPFQLSMISIDDSNAFTVEESIRDIFMEEELPDIIICLSALNTTCVYQAVVDYNKVGQVYILGYYDTETILKGIEREVISATMSIDTNQMGRECVEALMEYDALGYTSDYFIADITLIDKQNVSEFMGGDANAEK